MSSCKGRGAQRFVQSRFGFVSLAALLCLSTTATKLAAQTSAQETPKPAAQQTGQPAALPLPAVRVEPARRPAAKKAKQAPTKKAAKRPPAEPSVPVTPINPNTSYNTPAASSPRLTAPLLNLPQTATVVTPALMREQGTRDLTEVLRTTPGITFDGGENGFGTSMANFKLRGFNTSGDVFIDGSRDNGSYQRDMFNVDRVEVFKGPAADNGRGSAGGYINMVTKVPVLQNFFAGETSVGWDQYNSEARRRATMDFNYMLSPTTAVRFNGMFEDSGVAGRDIAEAKPRGIAPSIAFGLGTEFRTLVAYEHQRRRDLPDWGVPAATIPGMMRFDPVAGTAPRDAFYGLRSDFDNTNADAARVRFEYDVHERGTITNQTRWSRVDRISRFTTIGNNPFGNPQPPITPASLAGTTTIFYDRVTDTVTNQTNYSSEFYTGMFKHNLSTGIDLSREESDSGRFGAAVPAPGNTPLFDPNPDRAGPAPFNLTQTANVKVNTIAGYLYDTMHLSRHWQITGGFRLEHYKVRINSKTAAGAPTGEFDNLDISETTLNGKIGVVYKPADNGSIYAAVGLSHLPPGSYLSNSDISRQNDDAFPNLIPGSDPVRSINYEVGTKWDFFNGRLSTTAALFHTDRRVPITGCVPASPVPPSSCAVGAPIELKGYGHQIAQGLELGVAGNVTEHWKVFGGLLWMRTERKHSEALDAMRMAAQPGDYPVGFRNGTNGDQLAFTPNFSATLWTTYLVPTTKWTVGGGAQYVGSSWAGRPDDAARVIPNGVFGKLPSYFVMHAMTSYEVYKDVHIRFNVDNIADRKYAVSSNWPAQRVMLGAPRTYRVSTSFRF